MSVDWRPHLHHIGGSLDEGAKVWVHDVASDDRANVRRQLVIEALPSVETWLQSAVSQGDGWQATRHRLAWFVREGSLVCESA